MSGLFSQSYVQNSDMFESATAFKQKYTVQDTPGESFWIYFEGGSEEINGEIITYNQNPNYTEPESFSVLLDDPNDPDRSEQEKETIAANNLRVLKNTISLWLDNNALALQIYGQPNTWDVSQITSMDGLFKNSTFNEDISNWDTRNVTNMASTFAYSEFNGDISKWDTSNVTNMAGMFEWNFTFEGTGGLNTSVQTRKDANGNDEKYLAWDVKNVTNMALMFYGWSGRDYKFNGEMSNWNTGNVVNMNSMFQWSYSFNQQIGEKTVNFTGDDYDLGSYKAWDLQKVENMSSMFREAGSFNNGVNNSIEGENNVGNPLKFTFHSSTTVTLFQMFFGASSFNAPIYHWENTSSIRETNRMFKRASKFNQEIRTWDMTTALSNNSTTDMFADATAFQNDPPIYTSVDTPQLAFWDDNFSTYTVKAENLSWSDVDVTYYKNPVYG